MTQYEHHALQTSLTSMYIANRQGDKTPLCRTPQNRLKYREK